ncbi:AAA family ATPase [Chloroflexi bacterium TSY]|nr:AAA family ATPase [Chloroflexi bacterium TSY]
MSERLELLLLGSPEVRWEHSPLTGFRSDKARALLYYLAATRRTHMRPTLAGLLWGETPEAQARLSLNQTLSNLRKIVGSHLTITRQTVVFNTEIPHWIDVVAYETNLKAFNITQDIDALEEGLALLRGDFLEGFHIREAPEYEQWISVERARFRESALSGLGMLSAQHVKSGNLTQAILSTRRILNLEPWREDAHRQLMLLLAQSGQQTAALAQFESCQRILDEELAVPPSTETIALVQRIRRGEFDQHEEITLTTATVQSTDRADSPITPPLLPNLPPQHISFVGRKKELSEIVQHLVDPDCRLLTLIGPGGIGKTRLAVQVMQELTASHHLNNEFRHGLLFVPLQAIPTSNGIVSAIAQAAHFEFYSNTSPSEQLLAFLREKQMLLVLDNFEHLLDGAVFLSDILLAAPDVKILVTSREVLNLQESWVYSIRGLTLPESISNSVNEIDSHDAVAFFEQCARRAQGGYSLQKESDEGLQAIAWICQLVDGIPLGIELAAAWLKVMPLSAIVQEIEQGLDILTTRFQNVDARHRSMRVVLEQSWQLLSENEQEVLSALSVFQGEFSREAADNIAGAKFMVLATLVEKSLITVTNDGRYRLHQLLWQFAAEKLESRQENADEVRARHSRYYLVLCKTWGEKLLGTEQRLALEEIDAEFENIQCAWNWTVLQQDVSMINEILDHLSWFWRIRSLFQVGKDLFSELITHFEQNNLFALPQRGANPTASGFTYTTQTEAEPPILDNLYMGLFGRISIRCGAFSFLLGDYEAANIELHRGLAIARSRGHQSEIAYALNLCGQVSGWKGNAIRAKEELYESFTIYEQIGGWFILAG